MNRRRLLTSYALAPLRSTFSLPEAVRRNGRAGGPCAGYFPNLVLRTHENKAVRFYGDLIEGKIVVINMMYAQCEGICPGMTANLVKVQKLLGDRLGQMIFMYSLTLQPEHDTPRVLKRYAEMYGTKPVGCS